MCILEWCKLLISWFHYGYIKKKYDRKSKLLFTGTDSLMYLLKTEYFYEDFWKVEETFGFRNYSKIVFVMTIVKINSRKFKDGTAGAPINEFFWVEVKDVFFLKNNTGVLIDKKIKRQVIKRQNVLKSEF